MRRRDWLVVDGTLRPLGYVQDGTISTASALPTIPVGARLALIVVTGQPCRWRDDGVAPTASAGIPIAVDTPFWYNGDLAAFQIIETTATAVLNVSYYA